MWNDEATLLEQGYAKDEYGQQIPSDPIITKVLCKTKSVGRREHYSAAQVGLQLDIVIVLKNYEYEGQDQLMFNKKKYQIERTYSTSYEEIELMCRLLPKND